MKNQITFLILLIVLGLSGLQAQVSEQWVAKYSGPGNGYDIATSLAVDRVGNIYVTGGASADYTTIKYNSSGVAQWIKKYNGPIDGMDHAQSIAVDGSGNVYVTGYSFGLRTNEDYATIKYNSSGVQLWVQRYNGSGTDIAYSIAVDGSGNVYITGTSVGSETFQDYATIKYNSSGVEQWIRRYNGPGNDEDYAYSLAVNASGNVYITGTSVGSGTFRDCATIKYNSSGVEQWIRRYNGPGNDRDYGFSLAIDGSENVYVSGGSYVSATNIDYATIKYNSSGVEQWVRTYDGPGNNEDYAGSIEVDGSGNVYVTGISDGNQTFKDYATIKYNSSGLQQWIQRYDGPGNNSDRAHSLAVDHSGNVYVTGSSLGIGTETDYATIKYNSSGAQQWVQRYNGLGYGRDEARSIAVDGLGNAYVTGSCEGINTSQDYVTIKYSSLVGISQTSNSIPEEFSLSQNFPNPFNPVTNLEFGIPKWGFVSLKIYNMLGNEIAKLVNENLNPGIYSYNFDASDLATGVYFYELQTDHFNEVKKMTLIK